jgi:hypothetical protein
MKVFFLSIIFSVFLYGCSGKESDLKGKWQFEKEVNNLEQTIDANSNELKNLTYEFHDKNRYSKQGISVSNEEKLITTTGEWNLIKDKKDSTEIYQLLLREEKLEGILEMKYTIVTLEEKQLVWSDNRNNKYYFSKIDQ